MYKLKQMKLKHDLQSFYTTRARKQIQPILHVQLSKPAWAISLEYGRLHTTCLGLIYVQQKIVFSQLDSIQKN